MKVAGTPKPAVRWFIHDKQIVRTPLVTILEEDNVYTLIIKKVKPKHIGPITCEAYNELGVISTTTILQLSGIIYRNQEEKLGLNKYL